MATRMECFWGGPGSGKSEAIARLMLLEAQKGRKSRAIIGDGSKATYVDNGLIEAGVVEVVDFTVRKWPFSTLKRLCEGWWPKDVKDPQSELVAPDPTKPLNLGVFAIEGLSVGAQYLLGDQEGGLSNRAGKGENIGGPGSYKVTDGETDNLGKFKPGTGTGEVFGGNTPSHYGFAQRRLVTCIELSKGVDAEFVIWTAHERTTEDKVSNEKLVGPEAAGEALTASIPRLFNNTLHFTTASKRVKGKTDPHTQKAVDEFDIDYRIYTRDHIHPDGGTSIKFKAITRGVSAAVMPQFLQHDSPGDSIQEFYRLIDQEREKRSRAGVEALKQGKVA